MYRDAEKLIATSAGAALRPEPRLTVSEWADEHRYLTTKSSSEPGRWRTSRTPYLREIMDCLSSTSPIWRVDFMSATQIGKTEAINCVLGYVIHHAPGPVMVVQPTSMLGKRWSTQRLAPMIDASAVLRERVAPPRSRDASNTTLSKDFRGGTVIIAGANSSADLRSMPVRYLLPDEIDIYPFDLDGEGDPLELALRRTETFARRKVLATSTPTIRDLSRIERGFLAGDQRRYHVPCPHCAYMQILHWERLKWDRGDHASVRYECARCHASIEEQCKHKMLADGEWRPGAKARDERRRSYHLSALYSPPGLGTSWVELALMWEEAQKSREVLKTFTNCKLAESWDDEAERVDVRMLKTRLEPTELRTAPAGCLLVTAGADVQRDRIEVTLWGSGARQEEWIIDHKVLYGDPAVPPTEGVWRDLLAYLRKPIPNSSGRELRVAAAAVDSGGHHTQEVYAFTRLHAGSHIIAIKGIGGLARAILSRPTKVDVHVSGRVLKAGARLWSIGVDVAKGQLMARLQVSEPGPSYVHIPSALGDGYLEGLTSERLVTGYVKGRPVHRWRVIPGRRNEPLDCAVYARAAAVYLGADRYSAREWEQLAERLEPAHDAETPASEQPRRRRRARGGYVNAHRM